MPSFHQGKDTQRIGGGPRGQFFQRHTIGQGQRLGHLRHERALIALPSMGDRSHIRAVCLQHQPVQRHALRQILTQMAALERAYATHAKHETREAQQLFRLPGIARKQWKTPPTNSRS